MNVFHKNTGNHFLISLKTFYKKSDRFLAENHISLPNSHKKNFKVRLYSLIYFK